MKKSLQKKRRYWTNVVSVVATLAALCFIGFYTTQDMAFPPRKATVTTNDTGELEFEVSGGAAPREGDAARLSVTDFQRRVLHRDLKQRDAFRERRLRKFGDPAGSDRRSGEKSYDSVASNLARDITRLEADPKTRALAQPLRSQLAKIRADAP